MENDGKTKDTRTGHKEYNLEDLGLGMANVQTCGGYDGIDPIRTTEEGDSWRCSDRQHIVTEGSIDYGKILECLDALEKDFLEYVDGHQARLNARLKESQIKKQNFLQEASEIRSGIYDLIAKEHCNNTNS